MKPNGFSRYGRMVLCGLVLVAMSIAVVRMFELIEAAKTAAPAAAFETISIPAEPSPIEIWLNDPQGDPAPFWSDLVALAENPRTSVALRERVRLALARHSMPLIQELIRKAKAQAADCEAEFRVERERRDQKVREIDRKIEELKQRYPLAVSAKDPDLFGPDEKKELQSYAQVYKRERLALDGAMARLGDVLRADFQRIRMDQSVFNSQICQLQRLLENPGYLPVASLEKWDPTLLPPEKRVHAHVCFEAADVRLDELMRQLSQICGAPVTISPEAQGMKEHLVNLCVNDLDAAVVAKWVAVLADLDVVEKDHGFVLIKLDHEKLPPPPDLERPATATNVPKENPEDF